MITQTQAQPQPDGRSLRALGKRRARKAEILHAAQKIIGTQGYNATSIDNVLEAANISRGTFYLYFKSRRALFLELIESFSARLQECIHPVKISNGRPIQDMLDNIKRVVDLLFDNQELTVILLREAVAQDPRVEEKMNQLYHHLYRKASNALQDGARWGVIRKVDERVVAMALIGSIKEVLYQYLIVRYDEVPDRETIARELLSFGLQGLRK